MRLAHSLATDPESPAGKSVRWATNMLATAAAVTSARSQSPEESPARAPRLEVKGGVYPSARSPSPYRAPTNVAPSFRAAMVTTASTLVAAASAPARASARIPSHAAAEAAEAADETTMDVAKRSPAVSAWGTLWSPAHSTDDGSLSTVPRETTLAATAAGYGPPMSSVFFEAAAAGAASRSLPAAVSVVASAVTSRRASEAAEAARVAEQAAQAAQAARQAAQAASANERAAARRAAEAAAAQEAAAEAAEPLTEFGVADAVLELGYELKEAHGMGGAVGELSLSTRYRQLLRRCEGDAAAAAAAGRSLWALADDTRRLLVLSVCELLPELAELLLLQLRLQQQ